MNCDRCGQRLDTDHCQACAARAAPHRAATGPDASAGATASASGTAGGPPFRQGDWVSFRYQVREELGAGPMGWTYRALDAETEGEVALKILLPRLLQRSEHRSTFLASLQRSQRLRHPNVARVLGAGFDGATPFIASELSSGVTLRRLMDLRERSQRRFSPAEVESIVGQIASGLETAGPFLPHGNLKPENLVILPQHLRIADFGVATGLPRASFVAAQKAAGSLRYLAPELLQGGEPSSRTDVFSLAALAGELWTGRPHRPGVPLQASGDLPAPVEAVLRRGTQVAPAARYLTAGELAAALAAAILRSERHRQEAARAEDAEDVIILEDRTDPRLRLARALLEIPVESGAPAAQAGSAPLRPRPFATPPPFAPSPFAPAGTQGSTMPSTGLGTLSDRSLFVGGPDAERDNDGSLPLVTAWSESGARRRPQMAAIPTPRAAGAVATGPARPAPVALRGQQGATDTPPSTPLARATRPGQPEQRGSVDAPPGLPVSPTWNFGMREERPSRRVALVVAIVAALAAAAGYAVLSDRSPAPAPRAATAHP